MRYDHPWDLTPDEAARLQEQLRDHLQIQPWDGPLRAVGGVDVGFPRGRGVARAAAVVVAAGSLELLHQVAMEVPVPFPYIPGLLSFREVPAILAALNNLPVLPDVILCDGHGYAHPRRFGLACHLGLLLGKPVIGCAKSILVGQHPPLPPEAGSTVELVDQEEVVGAAVRTRTEVRPVYVSVGHLVDLPSAIRIVLACGAGFRLPEPVRLADRLASRK